MFLDVFRIQDSGGGGRKTVGLSVLRVRGLKAFT